MSVYQLSFVLADQFGNPVGEVLEASAPRTLVFRRNVPATATVAVKLEDRLAYWMQPGPFRLKVYRTTTPAELAANPSAVRKLVFYGQLPSTGVEQDSDTGVVTATFQDPRWRFNQLYLPTQTSFVSTGQGSILWSIIAAQMARTGGSTLGLQQGVTDNSQLRDRVYDAGKNVAELVDEMTKVIDGPDVDFSPNDTLGQNLLGQFQSFAKQGSDRPDAVFVHGPELPSNVAGIKRSWGDTISSATAVGTNTNGDSVRQTYSQAGASVYGLLEEYSTDSDVSVPATLLAKATGTVQENYVAKQLLSVSSPTPEAPYPLVDFFLGDTVQLTERYGIFQMDRVSSRVEGFTLSADENAEVTVTSVELSQ